MVISLNKNSRNSKKPRNSEEKWIPPVFTLLREFTVILRGGGKIASDKMLSDVSLLHWLILPLLLLQAMLGGHFHWKYLGRTRMKIIEIVKCVKQTQKNGVWESNLDEIGYFFV